MSIQDRNLKPGTVLVARYKKEDHRCEVVAGEEGKLLYRLPGGREFTSPSAAGSAVMGGTACNGWRFWTVEGAEEPKPATVGKKAKTGAKAKRGKAKAPAKNEPEPERKVSCGDCGQEFPNGREAAAHMRDEHNSVEAAGSGP